jgi:hypothetical protein
MTTIERLAWEFWEKAVRCVLREQKERTRLEQAIDQLKAKVQREEVWLQKMSARYSPPDHCCPSCACPEYSKRADRQERREKWLAILEKKLAKKRGGMTFYIGDQQFDLGNHRLKKLEIAFDENGYAWFLQLTSQQGEQYRYKNDGMTVPMESGVLPPGVYQEGNWKKEK